MTTALTLETYTFGLSRTATQQSGKGKMRFVLEGEPKESGVLVDRIVGQWWVDHADVNGNIHAECALNIIEDERGRVAYLYHPDIKFQDVGEAIDQCGLPEAGDNHDNCHIATANPFPQGRDSHWRLCYAREIASTHPEQPFWRLRDERTNELWFVKSYAGPMNVNWMDSGTHVFADGPCWVDENLIAHFGEGG